MLNEPAGNDEPFLLPPEDTKGICCSLVLRVTETTLKEVIDSSLGTAQK